MVCKVPLFLKRLDRVAITIGISWIFFIYILTQTQSRSFYSLKTIGSTLSGGLFLLWTVWLYLRYRKRQSELAEGLLFSAGWIIAFLALYWWRNPSVIQPSFQRYMTLAAVGPCVFFGCLVALMRRNYLAADTELKRCPVTYTIGLLLGLIFIVNFIASSRYLKELIQIEGREVSNAIWESFTRQVPAIKRDSLFYFESNSARLHPNVTYGFPQHVGILYKLPTAAEIPYGTPDFEEFSSLIQGKGWEKHGRLPHKIAYDRIYAFRLEGSELIDIKPQVMERLKETLSEGEF